MTRKKRIILFSLLGTFIAVILALALSLVIGVSVYLGTYYHADDIAVDAYIENSQVQMVEIERGVTAFLPKSPKAGFIFYPGGKVEVDSYYPLLCALAKNDILAVSVKMPFNLAVFDINAAKGIKDHFPEITSWYIGGHSLGGSMSASFLDKNREDFDGLILLGSYSTVDFSDTSLSVLSIYGENDMIMNREKYEKYKPNLPDLKEHIIKGGNHAGFGMYGPQKGDGTLDISKEAQIKETADIISAFIDN